MPQLEINTVYIVAAGPVDDSSDICPDARHRAHGAGLQRAVETRASKINVPPLGCQFTYRDHLSVGRGIKVQIPLVKRFGDHLAVFYNHAADFARPGRSQSWNVRS